MRDLFFAPLPKVSKKYVPAPLKRTFGVLFEKVSEKYVLTPPKRTFGVLLKKALVI